MTTRVAKPASVLAIKADRIARRLWPGLVAPPSLRRSDRPLVPVLDDLARARRKRT